MKLDNIPTDYEGSDYNCLLKQTNCDFCQCESDELTEIEEGFVCKHCFELEIGERI